MKNVNQNPDLHPGKPGQQGFALILAILALLLLTSLGLSLSTTTSTEFQIAVNHRWSEQARYNAEAGIEFAKEILSNLPSADWRELLPPARMLAGSIRTWQPTDALGAIPTDGDARPDAWGNPSRDSEQYSCDQRGFGRGYGVVIDDESVDAPYQFKRGAGGLNLNGAFTLWIRRPVRWTGGGGTTLEDYSGDDAAIVVSEGVAPFGNTSSRAANRATYIVEVLFSQGAVQNTPGSGDATGCSARQGQAGGSAQGTNSSGCNVLTGPATLVNALKDSESLGTGNLK